MKKLTKGAIKTQRRHAESYLGRKFILWNYAHKEKAYRDQIGCWQIGNVVEVETPVIVNQVVFIDDVSAEGKVIAVSKEGDSFVNSSLKNGVLLGKSWSCADRKSWPQRFATEYHDATGLWGTYVGGAPFVSSDGRKIVPREVYLCTAHETAFMPDDPAGCWGCYLKRSLPPKAPTTI